ncbi:MAG TPA: hypothetical protein VM821_05830 [Abditibacteriaceae bacterium]|nr:hypothetical protein [Abditibacteriaceae bacterium]
MSSLKHREHFNSPSGARQSEIENAFVLCDNRVLESATKEM